jgi:hypothetical protein
MHILASSKGYLSPSLPISERMSYLSNILVFSVCRENEASLAVLPDLLMELDSMNEVSVKYALS